MRCGHRSAFRDYESSLNYLDDVFPALRRTCNSSRGGRDQGVRHEWRWNPSPAAGVKEGARGQGRSAHPTGVV
jgi:hypothetical protein